MIVFFFIWWQRTACSLTLDQSFRQAWFHLSACSRHQDSLFSSLQQMSECTGCCLFPYFSFIHKRNCRVPIEAKKKNVNTMYPELGIKKKKENPLSSMFLFFFFFFSGRDVQKFTFVVSRFCHVQSKAMRRDLPWWIQQRAWLDFLSSTWRYRYNMVNFTVFRRAFGEKEKIPRRQRFHRAQAQFDFFCYSQSSSPSYCERRRPLYWWCLTLDT